MGKGRINLTNRKGRQKGSADGQPLQVVRLEDPLRHVLEYHGSGSDRDRDADEIIHACADADLTLDAGRDRIRQMVADAGLSASNALLAHVAKVRKATGQRAGIVPKEEAS